MAVKKIKRFIKEKKLEEHIALVGNLLNPYPIMKQCDCFVLLSKYEGVLSLLTKQWYLTYQFLQAM